MNAAEFEVNISTSTKWRLHPTTTGLNLVEMVNAYLTSALKRSETGRISLVTFGDYKLTGGAIVEHVGRSVSPERIRSTEFIRFRKVLASMYSSSRVGKMVTQTRMMFRWAYESELIESQPNFGPEFKSSSKRESRIAKAKRGEKLFTARQFHELLGWADDSLQAMIWLGINCGMGNTDVSQLTEPMVDLRDGWLSFPRPKTGVDRRMPLWPDTVTALKRILRVRPMPKTNELRDRVFLTRTGGEIVDVKSNGQRVDKLTIRFRCLLQSANLYSTGLGFYTLRHTFQTIGDEALDQLATSHIMGHVDGSMGGRNRERISNDRLRRVVDYVHHWLFAHSNTG